jgi:O-methyltransferase
MSILKRIRTKITVILRDKFLFFYPLGKNTLIAVQYALSKRIQGHYYEFGLYQGYTFYHAVLLSPEIHHFGFDSFEGMPENNEGGGFTPGRFKVGYKKVINSLLKRNAFSYKEHLIEGYYSNSLTAELQRELLNFKASVILIDCDLYESTVQVLNFTKPLLQSGTIVIFDDWESFDESAGEQLALKEFLSQHKNISFIEIKECTNRKMFTVVLAE